MTLTEQVDALLKGITPGGWQAEQSNDDGRHRIEVPRVDRMSPQVGYVGRWPDAQFIAAAPQLVRDLLTDRTATDQRLLALEAELKALKATRVDGWQEIGLELLAALKKVHALTMVIAAGHGSAEHINTLIEVHHRANDAIAKADALPPLPALPVQDQTT